MNVLKIFLNSPNTRRIDIFFVMRFDKKHNYSSYDKYITLHCTKNQVFHEDFFIKYEQTLRKKWSFPWRISSVNLTKSLTHFLCSENINWKLHSCAVLMRIWCNVRVKLPSFSLDGKSTTSRNIFTVSNENTKTRFATWPSDTEVTENCHAYMLPSLDPFAPTWL